MNDRLTRGHSRIIVSIQETHEKEQYLYHVKNGGLDLNVVAENLTHVVNKYPEASLVEYVGLVTIL